MKAAADARQLARAYTIVDTPLDVFELASALGLEVKKRPLDPSVSGYFQKTDGGWELGVNSLHHPNRQRFTLAHELGHYFLHRDKGPFRDGLLFRRENERNNQEREANEFAALILMPRVDLLADRNLEIEEIARKYGVSKQAAEFRIVSVNEQLPID